MYTEEVNKVALRNKDNKRPQTFDGVTKYPYRTNAFKVCEVRWWWWETFLLKNM